MEMKLCTHVYLIVSMTTMYKKWRQVNKKSYGYEKEGWHKRKTDKTGKDMKHEHAETIVHPCCCLGEVKHQVIIEGFVRLPLGVAACS